MDWKNPSLALSPCEQHRLVLRSWRQIWITPKEPRRDEKLQWRKHTKPETVDQDGLGRSDSSYETKDYVFNYNGHSQQRCGFETDRWACKEGRWIPMAKLTQVLLVARKRERNYQNLRRPIRLQLWISRQRSPSCHYSSHWQNLRDSHLSLEP
jgi:hypothetical protein